MKAYFRIESFPCVPEVLKKYHEIPSWVEVRSKLEAEVVDEGLGGMVLRERSVGSPYVKNYEDTGRPVSWIKDFNAENWVVFLAAEGLKTIGGLTIACRTPEVRMLNGRDDLACVWDIRVRPEYKYQGIGTELFKKAMKWSRDNGFKQLCVETQNVNIPACRFYLKLGCKLGAVNCYAYPEHPEETQLIWFMDL